MAGVRAHTMKNTRMYLLASCILLSSATPAFANVAIPSFFLLGGYQSVVIALLFVIVIEWRLLARYYPNASKFKCFLFSICANLATTFIGIFILRLLTFVLLIIYWPGTNTLKSMLIIAGEYIVAYLLSAVIEWPILLALQQKSYALPVRKVLGISIIMNFVSYVLLAPAYLILSMAYLKAFK